MRAIKLFLLLLTIGAIGFVAFAFLADLTPEKSEIVIPVPIEGTSSGGGDGN